jgi:phosphoglycolate phosphatase
VPLSGRNVFCCALGENWGIGSLMRVNKMRAVLFDLDGTLADTAPDLAAALNALLAEQNRPTLPFHVIRPVVSHGSTGLLRLGFSLKPTDANFAQLRERLLQLYAANLCRETRVFPGVAELLAQLAARDIVWGIVTNKPAFLTEPLIDHLGLEHPPACVVSGDTVANRKPHPEPMLHACAIARAQPSETLYVGDAERDIHAGRDAGMKTLVALFGYIGENEQPEGWGADGMIDAPLDVLAWINADEGKRNVR